MPWLYAQRGYFHNLCFVSTSSWLDESNAFESSHVPWVDVVWSVRSFISFRFTELLSVTAGLQERHRLHYSSIWNLKAYSSLPTSTLDFVRVTRISNLAGNAVVSVIQIPCGWGVCISGEIFLCTEGSRTGCHQVSPHSMPRHTFRLTCDKRSIYSLLLSCLLRCCHETVEESAGCSWNVIPWFLCRDSCLEVCLSIWPQYNWNSLICIKLGICVLYGIECVCQSNWSLNSFWDTDGWIILRLTYF